MKGEILHYDDATGKGYITGTDGVRYTFERGDIKQPIRLSPGTRVDFETDDRNAREIFPLPQQSGAGTVRPPQTATKRKVEPELTAWGYFARAVTEYYAKFSGRARRKEYWGFYLVYLCLFFAVGIVIGIIAAAAYDPSRGASSGGAVVIGLAVLAFLIALVATAIPTIAITVRRFHDIGQSGWLVLGFYVLSAVPYLNIITCIAWLVMLCIDSEEGENKYGARPK